MRKTRAILLALAILAAVPAIAGNGVPARMEYGVEWGYTATILHDYHYNYVDSSDGFRVDESATELLLRSNGLVDAYVGLDFLKHWSVSANAGYAGIFQDRRFFPVGVRVSYFLSSYDDDGLYVSAERGSGFFIKSDNGRTSHTARLGCAYRYKLSRSVAMDFMLSARAVTDHPDVYSFNLGNKVDPMYVRRSNATYGSINFTMSLSF